MSHFQVFRVIFRLACSFLLLSSGMCKGDENIVSMAVGEDGIAEMVGIASRQREINLSPSQLVALKSLIDEKRFEDVFNKELTRLLSSSSPEKATLLAKNHVDAIIRPEISKILSAEQIVLHRRLYLRRRFNSPSATLEEAFLKQIGLSQEEVSKVEKATQPVKMQLVEELREMQSTAIERILLEIPKSTFPKFANLFGAEFCQSGDISTVEIRDIPTVVESSATRQLALATVIEFRNDLKLSKEQRTDLMGLHRKQFSVVRDPETDLNKAVATELSTILRPEQRIAIIQALHREIVRTDFSFLIRPAISNYLQLSDDHILKLRPIIQDWQETIRQWRRSGELLVFRTALAEFPKDVRQKMEDLFEGVWEGWQP